MMDEQVLLQIYQEVDELKAEFQKLKAEMLALRAELEEAKAELRALKEQHPDHVKLSGNEKEDFLH